MDVNEIILFMISELGGKISSKTKIHKLCYFYSICSNRDMGFRPHYYGPFSPQVEQALDELEGIGLVDKKVDHLGESSEGFEIKRYDYIINEYGKEVEALIKDSQEKQELKNFLGMIREAGDPGYLDLSIAAKAHFIFKKENRAITPDEIQKKARGFGWNIGPAAIRRAEKLLSQLELIELK
jgi:uncharacterized protein YwgA